MYSPRLTAAALNCSTDTVPPCDSYATTVLMPRAFHLSKLPTGWLHTPITNGEVEVGTGVGVGVTGTGVGGCDDGGVTGTTPVAEGIPAGSAAFTTISPRETPTILFVPPASER